MSGENGGSLVPTNVEGERNDNFNIDASNQKPDVDYQKYITSADPFDQVWLQAFGGYRKIKLTKEIKSKLTGEVKTESIDDWIIDYKNRAINESGCSEIGGTMYTLISPNAVTSKLSKGQIYYAYRAKIRALRYSLELDYVNGNGYDLKIWKLPHITTTLMSCFTITQKSEEGYFFKHLTETLISTFISKNQQQAFNNQESMVDKIQRSFGFKK